MPFTRLARHGSPVLVALTLVLGLSAPASAQEPTDPNPGALTISGATDFTNAYMFRGLRQDDTKVILWPYFDLGLSLYSGDAGLKSVSANVGTWNSLHTGDAGLKSDQSLLGCACGKLWYESDFYATLGLGFGGGTTLSTTYTAYTSPNAGFTNVKEIAFKVAVDDSAYLHAAALKPYALVALEFNTEPGIGQADGGLNAGRYLELGVGPGWTGSKASITVPVKVGLSLSDYYEINEGTLAQPNYVDNKFGYLSVAGIVTVPIGGASKFGSWNVHGGVEFQQLGDTTKALNAGDAQKVIGSAGIGFTY